MESFYGMEKEVKRLAKNYNSSLGYGHIVDKKICYGGFEYFGQMLVEGTFWLPVYWCEKCKKLV